MDKLETFCVEKVNRWCHEGSSNGTNDYVAEKTPAEYEMERPHMAGCDG